MDLTSQVGVFVANRIYNSKFLIKALLFTFFITLSGVGAQEITPYSSSNESNSGLLKRAELLLDTDVITSIELSKKLLSKAQSANDVLLAAKLHNSLGKAYKKNNN
ncbi:GGDEF domain-containing protein, partial [Pseudoalteromonas ruthenica]